MAPPPAPPGALPDGPRGQRRRGAFSERRLTAQRCVDALPVRLHSLADWRADPAARLGLRALAAEEPLLDLAAAEDPILGVLAAVLLAHRARQGGARPVRSLPGRLRAAFEAAIRAPATAPACWRGRWRRGKSLPALAGVPREELPRLAQAAERVAVVQGLATAIEALEHLAESYAPGAARARRRQRRLDRFQALCRDALPENRTEAALAKRLRRLPSDRRIRARGLVQAFLAWIGPDGERPVVRRRLLGAALGTGSASPAVIGRAICGLWKAAARNRETPPGPSRALQEVRLAISLLSPAAGLRLSGNPKRAQRDLLRLALGHLAAGETAERVPILGSVLIELSQRNRLSQSAVDLCAATLPVELARRALVLEVARGALRLAATPDRLRRYLDCVDPLRSLESPPGWLEADWFLRLFDAGRAWSSALVLALAAQSRSKR